MGEVELGVVAPMRLMVLDGSYAHSVSIATELVEDLGATIIGVGTLGRPALHRSRFCHIHETAPDPQEPSYIDHIIDIAQRRNAAAIVPVGFFSHAALVLAADRVLGITRAVMPDPDGFSVASDKRTTYEVARKVGVRVPNDLTVAVTSALAQGTDPRVTYPLIVKTRYEAGGSTTAIVPTPHSLANAIDTLRKRHPELIFQEYIEGGPSTYAYCGYFCEGEARIDFQHHEVLSVPRHGGSGVRVNTYQDREVAELGRRLLLELRWNGVAQVEFKRSQTGELILMEINPKFWASYALASRTGHRIATTAVADALDLSPAAVRTRKPRCGRMVFPVRELAHTLRQGSLPGVLRSALAMAWPLASMDVRLDDLAAYLPSRPRRSRPPRSHDA